ncbi:glycosyl hydrolase [Bacteroidia bacterium]|nr:glycosyl hydrolase [Bacteroidia bacterium]
MQSQKEKYMSDSHTKKISVLIPCYNEEENVVPISKAVVDVFEKDLFGYDYELVFIDNHSTDNTRPLLREICKRNRRIKAIFNAKNFGWLNSPFHGLCQTTGDCTVCLCCDFQDPVELIPSFVAEWEKGAMIVSGIKTTSKENKVMRFFRTCYYKTIKKMSAVEQIEHFTGFGLYDKSFVDVLRNLHDPTPFLRGIVAELGFKRKDIEYEQPKRKAGQSKSSWYLLYDAAMVGFTSYTKIGLRIATLAGFATSAISLCVALFYLVYKLVAWDSFSAGSAPIIIGVFFVGALQLFFIGFIGEYVMAMNARIMNRPLVIEEERINFDESEII